MNLLRYFKKRVMLWILLPVLVMSVFVGYLDSKNSELKQAQAALFANANIEERFGDVQSADLTKRFYFASSPSQDPYSEYIFLVKGSAAKGLITVQVKSNREIEILPNYKIFQ